MEKIIDQLVKEARMAYEFGPNSYTFSAYNAALSIRERHRIKEDWIEAVLDYYPENILDEGTQ